MRSITVPFPVVAFTVATRAALGVGIGLLVASRLTADQRRKIGLTLVSIGAATTIPAVRWLSRGIRNSRRRSIPADAWAAELDGFSRQHEGWLVSIETRTPDGRAAIEARDLPLLGVSRASRGSNDIAITVGDADHHLTHDVHDATALWLELTPEQAERALVIEAQDGSTTRVEFRTPIRSEQVDGK
jgi:Family of unknown function (DUF5335)